MSLLLVTPISEDHRRAMRWFSSIAQVSEPCAALSRSVECYQAYATTNRAVHLNECEEFLRLIVGARRTK